MRRVLLAYVMFGGTLVVACDNGESPAHCEFRSDPNYFLGADGNECRDVLEIDDHPDLTFPCDDGFATGSLARSAAGEDSQLRVWIDSEKKVLKASLERGDQCLAPVEVSGADDEPTAFGVVYASPSFEIVWTGPRRTMVGIVDSYDGHLARSKDIGGGPSDSQTNVRILVSDAWRVVLRRPEFNAAAGDWANGAVLVYSSAYEPVVMSSPVSPTGFIDGELREDRLALIWGSTDTKAGGIGIFSLGRDVSPQSEWVALEGPGSVLAPVMRATEGDLVAAWWTNGAVKRIKVARVSWNGMLLGSVQAVAEGMSPSLSVSGNLVALLFESDPADGFCMPTLRVGLVDPVAMTMSSSVVVGTAGRVGPSLFSWDISPSANGFEVSSISQAWLSSRTNNVFVDACSSPTFSSLDRNGHLFRQDIPGLR